jgi:DHA1 family multidrug resistance protein-like MFS transporter
MYPAPHWKVNLYTVWVVQILSMGAFGFGFPFLPFYMQDLGVEDPEQIQIWTGVLASLPGLALAIMAPVWGTLADRIGKKWMMIRAISAAVLILFGMGLAQNVWHLAILRLLQGTFTGTIGASSALIASGTPDKRLSSALGFLGSSTFIGLTIGPAAGGLVAERFGFRPSFFIGSVIMLFALLLVVFVVREPDPVSPLDPAANNEAPSGFWKGLHGILPFFTPHLTLLVGIFFLTRLGRTILPPFLPLHIQNLHASQDGVAAIVGIISAIGAFAAAVAGILAGRLAERIDPNKVIVGSALAGAVSSFFLISQSDIPVFTLMFAISIFAAGGIQPVVTSEMVKTVPVQQRGLFMGLHSMVGSIAWMLAPILGSMISLRWGTDGVIAARPLVDTLVFLLAVVLLFRLRKQTKPSRSLSGSTS